MILLLLACYVLFLYRTFLDVACVLYILNHDLLILFITLVVLVLWVFWAVRDIEALSWLVSVIVPVLLLGSLWYSATKIDNELSNLLINTPFSIDVVHTVALCTVVLLINMLWLLLFTQRLAWDLLYAVVCSRIMCMLFAFFLIWSQGISLVALALVLLRIRTVITGDSLLFCLKISCVLYYAEGDLFTIILLVVL